MAALAFTFHWPPSEIDALTQSEALEWHRALQRIHSPTKGA